MSTASRLPSLPPEGERSLRPGQFGTPGRDPVENGRAGGVVSGEVRRELGKTVRERLREKVEEDFEKIWEAFESALTSDDERDRLAGAVAVLAEAYGRPPQAIIGDAERPVSFVLESAFGRALTVRADKEDAANQPVLEAPADSQSVALPPRDETA